MARAGRFLARLFFGAAVLGAALVATAAWLDRRPARELIPAGAGITVEGFDLEGLFDRWEGTRFATAFAAGPTRAWLERSAAVRSLDAFRADIGRATGFTPRRAHLLEILGIEAAVGWYPADVTPEALARAPWVAAGRLSWPAAGIATALRAAGRLGLLGSTATREEISGSSVYSFGSGTDAIHLFCSGRLLVAGIDRDLVQRAARCAGGEGQSLTTDDDWARVNDLLPEGGTLRLWARGEILESWGMRRAAGPARAVGAVLSAGSPAVIDIFLDAPGAEPARLEGEDAPPVLALAGARPLVFHSAAGPIPEVLVDLISRRAADVGRLAGAAAPPPPAMGRGFAFAVTSADDGLFPRPQGLVAIGMRDAGAAQEALRMIFPAGARSRGGRWGTALSTRESLPLAGEFELWGTAVGERLVLATQPALLDALEGAGSGRGALPEPPAGRPLDSVTTLDVTRLLPVLRRYAPPLAGLVRARYRGAPDLAGDVGLLATVRAIAVTTGTSSAGTLSRITLDVGDLPPTR